MYKVYADDILIHDSVSPSKEVHLIDPSLSLVDSAAGSFSFTMTPFNVGYDDVEKFSTTIIIYKDSDIIWTGRVLTQTDDFWHRRKFTCEGALAYLNDSLQILKYYKNVNSDTFLRTLISVHNTRVPSNRRFQVGTITQHDPYDPYNYKTEYKNTFDTIKSTLFDVLGGHLRVRYSENNTTPILDYLEDCPNTSSQEINFGENLLDFTKNWDLSNLCTVIIPRGKQLEEENEEGDKDYTTIASVNSGSIYLQNDSAVQKYGTVEQIVDFSEVDNPTTLKLLGQKYLQEAQFDDMILEVSAVDLHMITKSIVSFNLLDEVRCISAPHGLDRMFPITQIDIPLDKPDGVKYTMGSKENTSMSSQTVSSGKNFESKLHNGLINTLEDARRNAASIINAATTGYVNIITENETSQALVITNTPDIENATKLWRFNLNGLGYSDDGGNTYKLAMTMDGVIVADFIRTGIIDDGHGYNRWNLTTGEFQMAYNTEVSNSLGQMIEIVDIVNLAQEGVDTAEAAQETANVAVHKQTGVDNILNGTNKNLKLVSGNDAQWSNGAWKADGGIKTNKKLVDITDAPNPAIVKGVRITQYQDSSLMGLIQSWIVQKDISIASDQVYVVSCYARGSKCRVNIGYQYGVGNGMDTSQAQISSTGWKRYSYAFRTPQNISKIDALFGCTANKDSGFYLEICGMKLERGNTPSDWCESEWDTYGISTSASADYTDATATELKTYSKKYTDTISDADREFTKQQREALDTSFTQYKVLQRLTNNFKAKGIYLTNNQLYMNADYVRTGTLDAGIIKAGILTDKYGTNKWNMATGYLYTKNMEAVNIRASGRFECGDYYKMVNDGGEIAGYRNKSTYVGSISPNASIWNIPKRRTEYGLSLRASQNLDIRAPEISVRNRNDNGTSTICYTGTFKFDCVNKMQPYGNGGVQWWITSHSIQVINGLIVSIA